MGKIIAAYESIIRKHLKKKEEIDFESTRVVPPIYMVATNKRLLFFKEEENTLNFIYDSDKLVEAWKAGKSTFRRIFAPAPSDIYLHLVLSFNKLKEDRETCSILKEYILLNPELKLKEAIKIVENFSNLFPEKKRGYGGFGRAYFELGMIDKSAELLRIAAERMPRDNELQLAMYYLQLEKYEKAIFYINEIKRKYKKRFKTEEIDWLLNAKLNGSLSWAMAMLDWKSGRFNSAYNNFQLAFHHFYRLGNEFSSELMLAFSRMALSKKDISNLSLGSLIKFSKDFEFTGEKIARVWRSGSGKNGDRISDKELDDIMKDKGKYELLVINDINSKEIYFKGKIQKLLSPLLYKLLVRILKNRGIGGDAAALLENVWRESKDYIAEIKKDLKKLDKNRDDSTESYIAKVDKAVALLSNFLQPLKVKVETKKTGQYRFSRNLKYCLIEGL